jgi:hypothetical protein
MATQFITSIFPQIQFYTVTSDPNGALLAPIGSVALRNDAGNVGVYVNLDSLTTWSEIIVPSATGVIDWQAITQLLLADNGATALKIGSTGKLNLLVFDTLNGAEHVGYNGVLPFLINSGGLTVTAGAVTLPANVLDVALSAKAISGGVVGAALELRVAYPAGAANTDIVLPARAFRVTDARLVSGGAGGTVQVQTAAGAANVTDAMAPGVAGAITRAVSILNQSFASGATIRIAGTIGTVAGNVYVTLEPA